MKEPQLLNLVAAMRRSRHRVDDPTTSPERQRATNEGEAGKHGARVSLEAVDLDVSADKYPPWERPELGPYFTDAGAKLHDGFVCSRFDRMFRSMSDMFKVSEWAAEHRKVILICVTPMGGPLFLDFRSGPLNVMSRFLLILMAFQAETEVLAMKDRNTETAEFLRQAGRWRGGSHPYYLMPQKIEDGDGWTLVLNPETVGATTEAIDRVLRRASKLSIVNDYNARGILSPREYLLQKKGRVPVAKKSGWVEIKEREHEILLHPDDKTDDIEIPIRPKNAELTVATGDRVTEGRRLTLPILWNSGTLAEMLRSRALLGISEYQGRPVLGPDGMPIRNAEALIKDRATWERLQRVLDEGSVNSGKRYTGASFLLDIGYCGVCDEKLYYRGTMKTQGLYAYYRCRSAWGCIRRQPKEERCKALSFKASDIEPVVEQLLLEAIGNYEVMESVLVPGQSFQDELDEATEAWNDLTEKSAGKPEVIQMMYAKQIARLEARIVNLSKQPEIPDVIEFRSTGQTYAEVWRSADEDGRRGLLLESGIRVGAVRKDKDSGWAPMPRIPSVNKDDDVVLMGEGQETVVAMAIPRDIIRRSTGQDVELGFRDIPLEPLAQSLESVD